MEVGDPVELFLPPSPLTVLQSPIAKLSSGSPVVGESDSRGMFAQVGGTPREGVSASVAQEAAPPVSRLAWSMDGRFLLVGDLQGQITIFENRFQDAKGATDAFAKQIQRLKSRASAVELTDE